MWSNAKSCFLAVDRNNWEEQKHDRKVLIIFHKCHNKGGVLQLSEKAQQLHATDQSQLCFPNKRNSAKENKLIELFHLNLFFFFSRVSLHESHLHTKTVQWKHNAFFVHIHSVCKAPCITYFLISFPSDQQYAKLWLVGSELPGVLIFSLLELFF